MTRAAGNYLFQWWNPAAIQATAAKPKPRSRIIRRFLRH